MGWTKGDFIAIAFTKIGMASYLFDLTAQQLQLALIELDSMMATWNAQGIRLGYPLPSGPNDSSLADEALVPDMANEAIYTNLALAIAGDYGRQVQPTTIIAAQNTYQTLLQIAVTAYPLQLPSTMPAGSGNKPWRWNNPFVAPPVAPVLGGPDGPIQPVFWMHQKNNY